VRATALDAVHDQEDPTDEFANCADDEASDSTVVFAVVFCRTVKVVIGIVVRGGVAEAV
jgi:hypothetical protein